MSAAVARRMVGPPFDDGRWIVVHGPRIAVREAPSTEARLVGVRSLGAVVEAEREVDGWLQLGPREYCLVDGAKLGFGLLLEPLAVSLVALDPTDGSPLATIPASKTTTVGELRTRVAAHVVESGGSLDRERIALGRGRAGQRIIGTAYNSFGRDGDSGIRASVEESGGDDFELFDDAATVASLGLKDGDALAVRYDGDARAALGKEAPPLERRVAYVSDADGFPIYDDSATPRFWIDNGSFVAKLVVARLLSRGWEPATDARGRFVADVDATRDFFSQVDLCYIRSAKKFGGDVAPLDRQGRATPSLSARHVVNHFPGEDALTGKARLALALLRHFKGGSHPVTCVMRKATKRSTDAHRVVGGALSRVLAAASVDGGAVVIVKPSRGACGRGIKVFRLSGNGRAATFTAALALNYGDVSEVVVQSYVARPLLLGDGRKFDVRCYLLILSLPLVDDLSGRDAAGTVAYWHEGYLRASGRSFPGVAAPAGGGALAELDKEAHVTNHTFQKRLDGYDAAADAVDDAALRLPWGTLAELLGAGVDGAFQSAVREALDAALLGDRDAASTHKRSRVTPKDFLSDGWRPGQFAFLGVDFILDADGRPYLIEFSKAPGIRETPPFLKAQNEVLIPAVLDLVLGARRHWLDSGPVAFISQGAADPAAALRESLEPHRGSWVPL